MLIERVKNIESNAREIEAIKAIIAEINLKIAALLELMEAVKLLNLEVNKIDIRLTAIENL